MTQLSGIQFFLETVDALRDPVNGCPWDLAQTHESLLKYFHEELHEFEEALRSDGPSSPKTWDELGDVLLQVGLHSKLAEEKGFSSFNAVAQSQAEKLRRRHPHVFDPKFPRFKSATEVSAAWEQIKAWSKAPKLEMQPISSPGPQPKAWQLQSVPRSLPSLTRSARIGEKAAAFRFDWPDARRVLEKLFEEIKELEADQDDEKKAQEELGDLLFACAQYARKRGWDPEIILDQANQKFCTRFAKLEAFTQKRNLDLEKLNLAELEALWQKIKHPDHA